MRVTGLRSLLCGAMAMAMPGLVRVLCPILLVGEELVSHFPGGIFFVFLRIFSAAVFPPPCMFLEVNWYLCLKLKQKRPKA